MEINLPKAENELLIHLFEHLPVSPKASLFSYRSQQDHSLQYVAALPLKEESSLHVISTLGSQSNHIFLTVIGENCAQIAEVLSDIESYDQLVTHVGFGHVVHLEHEFLEKTGYPAALFLHPSVSSALGDDFPSEILMGKRNVHFLFVVFLSATEYEIQKKKGLDALLDHFEKTNRQLTEL